jgi:hypothetical protein
MAEDEILDAGRDPLDTLHEPMRLGGSLAVCTAGWLVPGLAHVLLRRWGRGAVFGAAILVMFILGLAMQGRLYGPVPEHPLHVFAFIANAGVGLAYGIATALGFGEGMLSHRSYDYGNVYLWVSGLLNYLVLLDAFDISQGRKP